MAKNNPSKRKGTMRTRSLAAATVVLCCGVSCSVAMAMVNPLEVKQPASTSVSLRNLNCQPKRVDDAQTTFTSTRRDFWISTTAAAAPIAIAFASPAMAQDDEGTAEAAAQTQEQQVPTTPLALTPDDARNNNERNNNKDNLVTEVVTLDLSIARGPPQPLRIEVFGNSSPEARFFVGLASATIQAPCAPTKIEGDANIDEGETCRDYESLSVGYKGSQLWRLVPNKRIDFGRVDSMFANRVPPTFATTGASKTTATPMRPSTKGAVSMKRGGGAFEFTVTPSYNPALDSAKEDLVVVGRIASESGDFLDYLNTKITVRKDILSSGDDVPPLGYDFARACDFTSPDKTCAQFKPIGRIVVANLSCESSSPTPDIPAVSAADAV